jgi:putative phosphoribosyl transferase
MKNILFKNREDSLQQLIDILPLDEMRKESWIVIATSAGGVPIAYGLSKILNSSFDFMFTYKVDAPKNNECEIAIVTETQEIIIHEELIKAFNIKLETIYNRAKESYNLYIKKYIEEYRNGKNIINMSKKNILFVDEGLNTGLTMMACIKSAISKHAKSVVVAVPILPEITIHDIELIADDLYCVYSPAHFTSIDFYYEKLDDVDLKTIKDIIDNKG